MRMMYAWCAYGVCTVRWGPIVTGGLLYYGQIDSNTDIAAPMYPHPEALEAYALRNGSMPLIMSEVLWRLRSAWPPAPALTTAPALTRRVLPPQLGDEAAQAQGG